MKSSRRFECSMGALLIEDVTVITMDKYRRIIPKGAVLAESGR